MRALVKNIENMKNTVLITGGAGYIGSHCVLELAESGIKTVIFDNLSSGRIETVNTLQNFADAYFCRGDLLNKSDIKKVFDEYEIDAVMHFAAYSIVPESVENPQKYYMNNISGTLNLIEAMLDAGVKKLVFSSTAAVYGEPEYIPIDENHPKNPLNAYGRSKFMIEQILDDCSRAYGLKSVRLRYFNAAGADEKLRTGERHNPETHLIPNILKSAAASSAGLKNVFQLYGDDYNTNDGSCIRDYIDVNDIAKAHLQALKYLENGGETEVFNLGSNKGVSVKEIFEACEKVTGRKIPVKICPRRAGDPAVLIADNKKARRLIHWKPVKTFLDSIETAYKWEMKNAEYG